ncbi:hypothetical protein Pst134EA_023043 [Puccinia striiformis f. sp. tritici]|uniref:hypothetical protein n=1 Tax=Puccinia striiformis f. sp. tritici TaxID=168172 RepID=UPI0020079D34|nr:hypothetical protein Pst134EA_023043 [Puccinia striiformis f. sp. tritici]KAH9455584.1 hypothetical protein Pst134EA_023043 [Puccinia striiformis f. sp. tritici]
MHMVIILKRNRFFSIIRLGCLWNKFHQSEHPIKGSLVNKIDTQRTHRYGQRIVAPLSIVSFKPCPGMNLTS